MKNVIAKVIEQEGNNDNCIFVFPSDIAASLWLEKSLEITKRETIPSDRFIAWDNFKNSSIKASQTGKRAVSNTIRRLFAASFTKQNKANAKLEFLIPPKFADNSEAFAPWLARVLPQLQLLENILEKKTRILDDEDRDLLALKKAYANFLEKNSFYEPSWITPPFRNEGNQFIVFFPNAIEDFNQYANILLSTPFVRIINEPVLNRENTPSCTQYTNIREEISSIVTQIEYLISQCVRLNDIAISVPDLETISPYLEREFSLKNIPIELRSGKKLSSYQAARFFSLIKECSDTNFSFSAMKALLLNNAIPWEKINLAQHLVQFGIDFHCVSYWEENGKALDVWEEAFKSAWVDTEKIKDEKKRAEKELIFDELKPWYLKLKRSILGMAQAKSFEKARTAYIIFRNTLLDMSLLQKENDAIVARCISQLNELVQLEQDYPEIMPENPWSFFVSQLEESHYVQQRKNIGVNIFPFRVAAGTPFPYHFVINSNMEHASVWYKQLNFLRPNKKSLLNTLEDDASATFFSLYETSSYLDNKEEGKNKKNSGAFFSFSEVGINSYSTPHCFFQKFKTPSFSINNKNEDLENSSILMSNFDESKKNNPFLQEKNWFHNKDEIPTKLYPIQKQGLKFFLSFGEKKRTSFLAHPFSASDNTNKLTEYLYETKYNEKHPRVTATDLNVFSSCNTRWFLNRVLNIERQRRDAELFNDRNLGLLYHDVLKNTYEKIKTEDKVFYSANIEKYKKWAREFSANSTASSAEFKGPLAKPLLTMLADRVAEGVFAIIDLDEKYLDSWMPIELESKISFVKNDISYFGIIDRISLEQSNRNVVLIDYKSGSNIPKLSSYEPTNENKLGDYQIPFYLFLVENDPDNNLEKIEHVWFGDIKNKDYSMIVNNKETVDHGRKRPKTRNDFNPAEKACDQMINDFVTALKTLDFTRPKNLPWGDCAKCEYRKVCRVLYNVRYE